MKKLLLCASVLSLCLTAKAQTVGVTATSVYDDFASSTEVSGISWTVSDANSQDQLAITRSNGYMTVAGTTGNSDAYVFFQVNFDNIDCTTEKNADIELTIENTSTMDLVMDLKLVDENDVQSDIEPSVTDVDGKAWGDQVPGHSGYYYRKALNGFTLAAGAKKTIKIDLSSVEANLGGLSRTGDGDGSNPASTPTTAHLIDPTAIKAVLFRVNPGTGGYQVSEGDGDPTLDTDVLPNSVSRFVGNLKITSFKVGKETTTGITTDAAVDGTLKAYPNPAKETLNVYFNAPSGAVVSLTDIVGNTVYSSVATTGENEIRLNTSNFIKGMYILNVSTEKGKASRKVSIQ